MAYTNPLIDSFCIVSGDSDYAPLVGKLKTMGKLCWAFRSEAASGVFMNACSEFQFLESVASARSARRAGDRGADAGGCERPDRDHPQGERQREMLASEVKSVLLRLRPNFSERASAFPPSAS
ncbi:MAG: NYN domain-containing protein [Christensenellales bacterium]